MGIKNLSFERTGAGIEHWREEKSMKQCNAVLFVHINMNNFIFGGIIAQYYL